MSRTKNTTDIAVSSAAKQIRTNKTRGAAVAPLVGSVGAGTAGDERGIKRVLRKRTRTEGQIIAHIVPGWDGQSIAFKYVSEGRPDERFQKGNIVLVVSEENADQHIPLLLEMEARGAHSEPCHLPGDDMVFMFVGAVGEPEGATPRRDTEE